MCGILAIVSQGDNSTTVDAVDNVDRTSSTITDTQFNKQLDTLAPRGPDAGRTFDVDWCHDNEIKLGFRRLAIMDTSDSGMQPFIRTTIINDDDSSSGEHKREHKDAVIVNGEIYNFEQLVSDYQLKTNSTCDCEVVIPLFNTLLQQSLTKTTSDSGGECKDTTKMISCTFERMVTMLDAEFAMVLVHDNYLLVARDRHGKRSLFFGYNGKMGVYGFASELKALNGIMTTIYPVDTQGYYVLDLSLPYDKQTFKPISYREQKVYNQLALSPTLTFKDHQYEIRTRLIRAVSKRLHADRPIGFLLSGGLDSSLIVAIATRILGPDKITCFSIGLPNSSDVVASKQVVKFLGINKHYIIDFSVAKGLELLSEVIRVTETFDITTVRASTPHYAMCRDIKATSEIKVIYSGEGSDEAHGSYRYYANADTAKNFHDDCHERIVKLREYDGLRVDKCVAGNGLEGRYPFLDQDYLNYVLSIDPELWMWSYDPTSPHYGKMEKQLLRDAFVGYLPHELLYRRKEAFSDAVSSTDTNWYKSVQLYADNIITDEQLATAHTLYPRVTPLTKEAYLYRQIYEQQYPGHNLVIDGFWLPNFQKTQVIDPSATVLECY